MRPLPRELATPPVTKMCFVTTLLLGRRVLDVQWPPLRTTRSRVARESPTRWRPIDRLPGVKFKVRLLGPDDSDAFARTFRTAMVQPAPSPAQLDARRPLYLMSRSFGACEGKDVVGTAAAWPCDMAVPGDARVAAAAVTGVGVLPTHTRRGILTNLMRTQLEDAADQGQPVAILYASESIIYGRFGYGIARSGASLLLETRHGRFVQPFEDPGRSALGLARRCVAAVPRDLRGVRPAIAWARSTDRSCGGRIRSCTAKCPRASQRRTRSTSSTRTPRGSSTGQWRTRSSTASRGGTSPATSSSTTCSGRPSRDVSLWRHALDLDLAAGVKFDMRMPDEPLRWMLADPRRLETKLEDQLWLRVLDVPGALAARTYGRAGKLVVDVADPFLGRGGRFEIDSGESGQATCKPSRRSADLEMTIADLGAAYLGGVSFAALAAAGRVVEQRAGALARADQLFADHPLPWCGTFF